ncbi:poly(rC)-binding protein 3 [Exaiptasia diaphana]|uniref:K Homology domain-containing protein n=1 Tax=Exaiptasia diaphana TaxID=2652724 RepID=A0A913Y9Q2_EXADI|nr:poly(rC)-binding protein 3 [Exaiptasia diaphana]KXJ28358.1 Poly(rC)-binding protein 3 [Exaiptasia diaphana]
MSSNGDEGEGAVRTESHPSKGRSHPSNLVVKMIMQGKDIGSIIGKGGATVKNFREESDAHINISDGSTPERIVSVTGAKQSVVTAFTLISQKLEEELINNSKSNITPPVTLRLIVPGSQCGSIIGKGGTKIQEIREVSGASVVVAGEFLPGSTERAVTLSGTPEALAICIEHLCTVMLEFPAKGHTMPYTPHKPDHHFGFYPPQHYQGYPGQFMAPVFHNGYIPGRGGYGGGRGGRGRMQGATMNQGYNKGPPTSHTMVIPKNAVGSIIGQKGSYITGIRQMSGASVKISDGESGSDKKEVLITGTAEAVGLAQFLINARLRQDGKAPIIDDEEKGRSEESENTG